MEWMTLWVDEKNRHSAEELLKFLQGRNLHVHVSYVEGRADPILFTRIGSFEGESNIRRAAKVLAAEEVA